MMGQDENDNSDHDCEGDRERDGQHEIRGALFGGWLASMARSAVRAFVVGGVNGH
jgi:hypothetical protein